MSAVVVRIVHEPVSPDAGRWERLLADARGMLAEVHRRRFIAAHAQDVQFVTDARSGPDPSGRRLVIVDAGSLPLAMAHRYDELVDDGRTPKRPADWTDDVRLDSPLDLLLAARDGRLPARLRNLAATTLEAPELEPLRRALVGVAEVAGDRRRELLIVGRESPTEALWQTDAVRALVRWEPDARQSFDPDHPEFLDRALGVQADAAILDTRQMLATRLRRRRDPWPSVEDRFASDLLLAADVRDPWLRALTAAAATPDAIPILLGGPSLSAWGVRLLRTGRRRNPPRA
jgi:hypothetical protein